MILNLNDLEIDQSILLNTIFEEIQEDFNKLIDTILDRGNLNIAWLCSNITSRHTYQSDLLHNCTYLILTIRIVTENNDINKVIAPNNEIKTILNDYFQSINKSIVIEYRKRWLKNTFKPLYHLMINISWSIKCLKAKNRDRIAKIPKNKKLILLDTFLLQKSIDSGKYTENYYGDMLTYLSNTEKETIYFIPTILGEISPNKLHEVYINSEEQILFKHDLLSVTDYFKGLILLVNQRWETKKTIDFKGLDVWPLVKMSHRRMKYNDSTFKGIINYLFTQKLKASGYNISLFINWSENQPIDKGLNKGFHTFFPNIIIKGYQGYLSSPYYNIYLCPTIYEIQNELIPDEIIVIGKQLKERIRRFAPSQNITVGPALRHVIHDINKITSKKKRILVLFPLVQNEISFLISFLENLNDTYKGLSYELLIKPHPSTEKLGIKTIALMRLNCNYRIFDGNLSKALAFSDLVIAYSTGAIIEALICGVPCILLGNSNGITPNPFPKEIDSSIWRLCYSSDDLDEAVEYFLSITNEQQMKLTKTGIKIRNDYFKPPTKENVRSLLGLN